MGLTNLLLMATGAAVLVFQSVSGQGTCGGVGGVREQRTTSSDNNFYINTAAPAACSGYVNSFSFRYYRPYTLSDIRYVFSFALYRESSTSAGTYDSVSKTFVVERTLSDIQSELGNDNFISVNHTVSESVPVEAGDVFGACVYDPPGNSDSRLDIVSDVPDNEGIVWRANSDVCSTNTVPSTITPPDSSQNIFLNLQAEIVPPTEPPPTGTTTIDETTPLVTDTTTVSMEMTGSSTNATGILTETITIGVIAGSVAALSVILVMSAAIVVLVVLLAKKCKSTKRDYSLPTPEISDGSAAELESNAAYGVSIIEEEAFYETIDSVNAMEPTLTSIRN